MLGGKLKWEIEWGLTFSLMPLAECLAIIDGSKRVYQFDMQELSIGSDDVVDGTQIDLFS